MRRSWSLIVRAALLAVALIGLPVACSSQARYCARCGRPDCRNLSFDITLRNGSLVRTCCPRCALHYLAHRHPEIASLAVKDFDTARRIDATGAIYVEGSDVTPCTATAGPPPRDDRGCCAKMVYDRCLPSLIAFASKARADSFARDHGGELRTFAELQAAVPDLRPR